MSSRSIGGVCVNKMGSSWTISFSIVRLPVPYGMLSLVILGCPGLCLIGWLICLLVSGCVVAFGVLLYGRWCLLVLCDACGGIKMIEFPGTKKGRWKSSSLFSFIPSYLGLLRF
jgi:hypothetical protein